METSSSHPLGVDGFAAALTSLVLDAPKSGTHKLVLLLALAETITGRPDAVEVRLDELAGAAVELLWRQVRAFTPVADAEPVVLGQARQNGRLADGSLGLLAQPVVQLRERADASAVASLSATRRALPDEYASTRRLVLDGLWKNPLPRLQGHAAGQPVELLYHWPPAGGKRAGRLELVPGAAALLNRFLPLVRPLVELEYTRQVAAINGIAMTNVALEEHLFGSERTSFPAPLRRGIGAVQGGRCFYGGDVLSTGWEVDHFIPWAFVPNNAVENLVGARRERNNLKRELLPSIEHLQRWGGSLEARSELGRDLAGSGVTVAVDPVRSLGVARYAYGLLQPGMPVWVDATDGGVVTRVQTASERRDALAHLDELIRRHDPSRRAVAPARLAAERRGAWEEKVEAAVTDNAGPADT